MADKIEVIASNNCSTDDTSLVIESFPQRSFLKFVNRGENLGGILNTLKTSSETTGEFFLLLTDDDWIEEGALLKVILVLEKIDADVGFIWGPLPTYDDKTGNLFTEATQSFDRNTIIPSGINSSIDYCHVAWALTRQIYRKSTFDFDFASNNKDNAYIFIALAARVMLKHSAAYLNFRYVHHVYGNEEYWGEFGDSKAIIKLRTMVDYCNVFYIPFYDVTLRRCHIAQITSYQLNQLMKYFSKNGSYNALEARFGKKVSINLIIARFHFNEQILPLVKKAINKYRKDILSEFKRAHSSTSLKYSLFSVKFLLKFYRYFKITTALKSKPF